MVRLGIIGCGKIAEKRVSNKFEADFVACSDIDFEASTGFGMKHSCKAYKYMEDMLPYVDAVVVSTSTDALYNNAIKAMDAGKHVLIEKPGGTTTAQISNLIEKRETNGLIAQIGFNHRYHPAMEKAKSLVDMGVIGNVMFVQGTYGHGGRLGYENEWRGKKECGGGEGLDKGVHLIDLANYFFGDSPFTDVGGFAETLYWDMNTDDNIFMVLKNENGQIAHLNASSTNWRNTFNFEIHGKNGKLAINGLGGSYGTEKLILYSMKYGKDRLELPAVTSWEFLNPDNSFEKELSVFTDRIISKKKSDLSLEHAYEAIRIVELIKE